VIQHVESKSYKHGKIVLIGFLSPLKKQYPQFPSNDTEKAPAFREAPPDAILSLNYFLLSKIFPVKILDSPQEVTTHRKTW
jgi:hypothetical protein